MSEKEYFCNNKLCSLICTFKTNSFVYEIEYCPIDGDKVLWGDCEMPVSRTCPDCKWNGYIIAPDGTPTCKKGRYVGSRCELYEPKEDNDDCGYLGDWKNIEKVWCYKCNRYMFRSHSLSITHTYECYECGSEIRIYLKKDRETMLSRSEDNDEL